MSTQLTEEQIQDFQEVQDSLLIPFRTPAAKLPCKCGECKRLNRIAAYELEQTGDLYGPEVIPQLAGKVSTKIRRV